MKTQTQYRAPVAAALALTLMLTGCGGMPTASQPTPAVDVYSYEPPTPTYAPGSYELAAFNLLNAERSRCGFGKLKQSPQLDQAARNHAQWVMLNNWSTSHEEQPGTPGFTGVRPGARATAVGYDWYRVSEGFNIMPKEAYPSGNIGEALIRYQIAAPIHATGLLSAVYGSDVGIGFSDTSHDPNSPLQAGVFLRGNLMPERTADAQKAAAAYAPGEVKTYPCEGSSGIMTKIATEIPNPVPGRDLTANPTGGAIMVFSAPGSTLKLGDSTLIHIASGARVPMRKGVTDGVGSVVNLGSDTGYYLPDVPLVPNARYQFTFSGTVNGKAFTKTFSFETGPI